MSLSPESYATAIGIAQVKDMNVSCLVYLDKLLGQSPAGCDGWGLVLEDDMIWGYDVGGSPVYPPYGRWEERVRCSKKLAVEVKRIRAYYLNNVDAFTRFETEIYPKLWYEAYNLGVEARKNGLPRVCNLKDDIFAFDGESGRIVFKVYKSAWEQGWDGWKIPEEFLQVEKTLNQMPLRPMKEIYDECRGKQ